MDLKKEAAKKAVTLIQNGFAVGLGAGATMAFMVECLQQQKELSIQLYTSSAATKSLLQQNGFQVNDIAGASQLDIYFDGCDQFDKDLNALKSGGGIHTMEKLLASMAKEFVLVGDESKYAEQLDTKFPLVLEVLPQAFSYVPAKLNTIFPDSKIEFRYHPETKNFILTENGNYLLDVWFAQLPSLSTLNSLLKTIAGVVETSLFFGMANKAIIAGNNGVRTLTKNQ